MQYNSSRYLARVDRSARTLAADGWDVVLVAIKDAETPAFEERDGYVVRRVELKSRQWPRWTRPARFVEAVWRTYRAALAEDADVYNPRDIYPLLVSWLAAKRRGAVLVYDSDELNLHRNWPWTSKRWWKVLAPAYEGFFIRRAAANITSDHGRADILACTYDIERPVVVRNVPERVEVVERNEPWRAAMLGDSARYLLIYQGILAPNRGLPELVQAMVELPDCALALVGWGALADTLSARVTELDLSDRVHLVGAVPYATMMRYTASADAGLIPIVGSCLSYVYAAPNKLFEDMMVGVPVVASDLPEMAAVVRDERVGTLIADPLDPASIVAAVRELLDGEEPLATIGARAREAALARHHWGLERERLLDVYRGLTLRPASGGAK
ncbi:MAG: glycosyltransferase [Coriobacteriia bacterium]|nr:glycosyltransferase [Coriobacteriia bacterium]